MDKKINNELSLNKGNFELQIPKIKEDYIIKNNKFIKPTPTLTTLFEATVGRNSSSIHRPEIMQIEKKYFSDFFTKNLKIIKNIFLKFGKRIINILLYH